MWRQELSESWKYKIWEVEINRQGAVGVKVASSWYLFHLLFFLVWTAPASTLPQYLPFLLLLRIRKWLTSKGCEKHLKIRIKDRVLAKLIVVSEKQVKYQRQNWQRQIHSKRKLYCFIKVIMHCFYIQS